jgi:hypothetical protein
LLEFDISLDVILVRHPDNSPFIVSLTSTASEFNVELKNLDEDYKDYCQKNNVAPINTEIAMRIESKNL